MPQVVAEKLGCKVFQPYMAPIMGMKLNGVTRVKCGEPEASSFEHHHSRFNGEFGVSVLRITGPGQPAHFECKSLLYPLFGVDPEVVGNSPNACYNRVKLLDGSRL